MPPLYRGDHHRGGDSPAGLAGHFESVHQPHCRESDRRGGRVGDRSGSGRFVLAVPSGIGHHDLFMSRHAAGPECSICLCRRRHCDVVFGRTSGFIEPGEDDGGDHRLRGGAGGRTGHDFHPARLFASTITVGPAESTFFFVRCPLPSDIRPALPKFRRIPLQAAPACAGRRSCPVGR
jgi:hypothetical protein